VSGIPIAHKARRFILLHGAAHGHKDGVPMANLVLHYANGETRALRLAYGIHSRNWVKHSTEKQAKPEDRDSILAWTARSNDSETVLRFYQTILQNPLPEEEIRSLDFVSLFGKPTPILFALTLDTRKALPNEQPGARVGRKIIERAQTLKDSVYVRDIDLRIVDAGKKTSLTNGSATLTVVDDASSFAFGRGDTDQAGRIHFLYPPQEATALRLLVRAPGFVPRLITISRNDPQGLPREITVELSPGARVGGIVRSPQGQPIPGAEVLIYSISNSAPREVLQTGLEALVADANGRWSTTSLPADFKDVVFHLSHPEYNPADYVRGSTGISKKFQVAPADLLAEKALLTMYPKNPSRRPGHRCKRRAHHEHRYFLSRPGPPEATD